MSWHEFLKWLIVGEMMTLACVLLMFAFDPVGPNEMLEEEDEPPPRVVKRVYADVGETVTCEQGHPICDIAKTIYSGDRPNRKEQMTNWRQDRPERGSHPVCAICGSLFYFYEILHFPKGWRHHGGLHYASLYDLRDGNAVDEA